MPTIVRKVKNRGETDLDTMGWSRDDASSAAAAVHSLNKGVQRLVQRHKQKLSKRLGLDPDENLPEMEERRILKLHKRIAVVVQHIRHCFTEFLGKLRTLQAGVECYVANLLPSLKKHCQTHQNKQDIVFALHHVFQWLLRLHDGYILNVSGECRHKTDVETAKKSKHPSHLNQESVSDGCTVLYAAENTYSGASWDEWMDSKRGLRCRLLALLHPLVPTQQERDLLWDDWTEPGEPAAQLEAIVCQAELHMQEVQSRFTDITKFKLVAAIRSALPNGNTTTATLQWKDKMEQLHVVSSVTGKVQLERYAGDFQVNGSVLPYQYTTPKIWWENGGMQLAALKLMAANGQDEQPPKMKRRKVIADSSSDEDDAKLAPKATGQEKESLPAQLPPPSAAGLVVKLVDAVTTEARLQSSLNAIKHQFGVNVESMKAAFDGLQAEEADAVYAADLVDNAPEDSSLTECDEHHNIRKAEQRVKRKKRALLRVFDDLDFNSADTAIWNAREVLREASMRAGDLILWSGAFRTSAVESDGESTTRRMLQKAMQYFSDSKGLVMAQQKLHDCMNHNKDLNDDIRFFRRNLLLLKGQAQTNTGIASIELAIHCYREHDPVRVGQLQTACKELEAAVASTHAMKSRAMEDAVSASNPAETTLDLFRAQQLEALAMRWKATALWYLYQKEESLQAFLAAASVSGSTCPPISGLLENQLLDAAIEFRIECYNAWTTLADLASRSAERATVALIRESPAFYDKLLYYAVYALENASGASKSIQAELQSIPEKYDSLCNEGSLLTSEDLLLSLKDIEEWWNRRKTAATQLIVDISKNSAAILCLRNDLLSGGVPPSNEALPTRRFVAKPRTRHRSKYNLGGVGFSNIGTNNVSASGVGVVSPRSPKKYRKWREDMVFDQKSGTLVPHLVYPSIAPEMPPHIAAIVAARKQKKGSH